MYSSRSIALHRAAVTVIVLLAVVVVSVQARVLWSLGLESLTRVEAFYSVMPLAFSLYAGSLAALLSSRAHHRLDGRLVALMLAFAAAWFSMTPVPSGSSSWAQEAGYSISYIWILFFIFHPTSSSPICITINPRFNTFWTT